ncbi:hypothetical protein GO755_38505 [Spirosoma sp. HMF4905]|uniref:Fibronectin type-III domain-containing protein n=1 Tax=Spirosoma arboris TaxID=2682092 RepID=A0A7K1SQ95_9BACT|nr:GEVED domain-containing protein [Spirosoma arboris]MVM35969.1 hypothetical protein [Spirosoma arboris]
MSVIYPTQSSYSARLFLYLLIGLAFALPRAVSAQSIERHGAQCGTESISPADRQALEVAAAKALSLKAPGFTSTITYVPIRPHIIRKSDGTGGYSMASLNNVLALTNKYYLQNGSGIQFYFAGTTPDYIDNTRLYNQYLQNTDDRTVAPYDVNNALNQYYVHAFNNAGLGGYAQFPADNVASTRTIILDEGDDLDMGNRLVPHELGHTFNLLHTFESAYGYELVTRGAGANCTTAGDRVCDTPADPYAAFTKATDACVSGCPATYTCSFVDGQGNKYQPSPTNIMSYYFPCSHDFTPGQYDRIQAGLALRQTHTSYTLDAPSTVMAAPSAVVATMSRGGVVITWQDNSSTEMGYFIERSTNPTTGFLPIGGVGPDVKTFTDAFFTPQTTYYYRIKASNSTDASISPTATAIAPNCIPTFTNDGCQYNITITGVAVNGTDLSQNSGCSPSPNGSFTSFTAVSGTVTAGQSATFTVTKGTATFPMGGAIWVDLDNNGSFDDSELLYQTPESNIVSTFSGSLAIPLSTTASAITMRVISAYNAIPSDPCGIYDYGETEEYTLIVNQPCIAPIASLSGATSISTGQTTTLSVSLTGTAPYSLTVNGSNGPPITFSGIAASPFNFTVSPGVSTTYTLGNVANSCGQGTVSGTATVTINCLTAPTLSVSPTSATLTQASPTASLSATGSGILIWSTGETTPVISVTASGVYSVTLTNPAGCTATASIPVTGADLTLTLDLPQANFAKVGTVNNFIVNIFEVGGLPTSSGNVTITVTAPIGYTLAFAPALVSTSVSGGSGNLVPVDNTHWTQTNNVSDRQLTLTMNGGVFIGAGREASLGFSITRTTANSGSAANITVNVKDDLTMTYDGNLSNNVYARIISGL